MFPAALIVATLAGFISPPAQSDCADVAACRQAALDASTRGDHETFHDLAWRAVHKGRPNDPELMVLLARAQSLSGRPHDALVMLRRLGQMGVRPDVAGDDFRRVRALPGWPEVEALLTGTAPPAASAPPASVPIPAARTPPESPPAGKASPRAPAASSGDDVLRVDGSTSLDPVGLVHDSVSRRFIVGDRAANKLVVLDEVFKHVNDLVGAASGGFFGLRGIAVDSRRGDLWVANSLADRPASLHKLQLVSGRVLFELPMPASFGGVTIEDLAVTDSGTVFFLDSRGGRLFRVAAGSRTIERAMAFEGLHAPVSIAPADERTVYVAHLGGVVRADVRAHTTTPVQVARGKGPRAEGLQRIRWHRGALIGIQADEEDTHRIVRITLNAAGTRATGTRVLEEAAAMPDATAAVLDGDVLFYLTRENGSATVRRIRLRRP